MGKKRANRMRQDIGRVEGKVDTLSDTVSEVVNVLTVLAKNEARVDAVYDQLDAHDKRIESHGRRLGEIERKCSEREVRLEDVEGHARSDKPVEQFVNEKAAKVLYTILGGAGALIATKLPAIVAFLFAP